MKNRSLDVRGLEAPEPLERILNELELLSGNEQLNVIHWREPLLLYPILEQGGWRYKTEYNEKTRSWLISIWKENQ